MLLAATPDSATGSVLALVGVAVTAAVTLLSTWRWPTLRRRLQGHVSLLKDLPDGLEADLRALVQEELDLLVHIERRRLEDWKDRRRRLAIRVVAVASCAFASGLLWIGLVGLVRYTVIGWTFAGLLVAMILLGSLEWARQATFGTRLLREMAEAQRDMEKRL